MVFLQRQTTALMGSIFELLRKNLLSAFPVLYPLFFSYSDKISVSFFQRCFFNSASMSIACDNLYPSTDGGRKCNVRVSGFPFQFFSPVPIIPLVHQVASHGRWIGGVSVVRDSWKDSESQVRFNFRPLGNQNVAAG
jgi:hypothetical protein